MKKQALRGFKFAILIVSFSLLISCTQTRTADTQPDAKEEKKEIKEAKVRNFSFNYMADFKDLPEGSEKVEVWLPVPHDNEYQKITNLKIDAPFEHKFTDGEYGNRYAYFKVEKNQIKDFAVKTDFDVERTEHINPLVADNAKSSEKNAVDDSELRRWLEPDRLVPIDGKIKQWAEEVVTEAGAKTDLEKAKAIYDHIIKTVKYDKSGKGWGRGDIYYACDERAGNCTDFHAIFIGYTRAVGIPSRFAIGFPLPPERGEAEIKGYHCWAEFYLPEYGWIPIDASEAAKNPDKREYFFGSHDENRVELTIGRDLILEPKQAGEPLNYFVYPYVEVDGKEYKEYEKTFKIKDIN